LIRDYRGFCLHSLTHDS